MGVDSLLVMEFLTPLDYTFVAIENDRLPMHIGGLLLFDGPPPAYEELLDLLASRIDHIPRYRQVIAQAPLRIGPPAWLDSQNFDLRFHVRNTAVPSPGTDEQLQTLTSRLMSARLDPNRPPWELWLVDGLSDDRFALVQKVHHAMVDGLSSADLMEAVLDTSPNPAPAGPVGTWKPQPWPSTTTRAASALGASIRQPLARITEVGGHLAAPRDAVKRAATMVAGTLRLGQELTVPQKHLLGQPGRGRRWVWAEGDLARVKAIRRALGGTVNDVILTVVAGGFRAFLLGRGEELTEHDTVRTMVPVSTRAPGGARGGNEVAALFADLPIGIADPVERLAAVNESMKAVKSSGMLQGTDSLVANAALVPTALFAAGGWLAARAPQPMVATVTTNVPGAQRQLYMLGRKLSRVMPFVPLGMNMLISTAILSYNGHIDIGITADLDRVPDVGTMAKAIEADFAALAAAAGA